MKIVSWNVAGFRACLKKGFDDFFKSIDADVYALQESKVLEDQFDYKPDGYYMYLNPAEKKGYSGTLVYSRIKPLNVTYGLNIEEHDHEGRVITLEFDNYYFVTAYVPNSGEELKRLDYRMIFEDDMKEYLISLDKIKPVIYTGDLNVAHNEIDIKNPKANVNNAGFTKEERDKMTLLLSSGFIDTFRYLYNDKILYSWWSYRFHARENNAGWRIDYYLVSDRIKDKVKESTILTDIYGSDHAPILLEMDI